MKLSKLNARYLLLCLFSLVFIICFAGCDQNPKPESEPTTYITEDYSALVYNDVEYVRFDVPFDMSSSGNIYGENYLMYLNKSYRNVELLFYDAAKNAPYPAEDNSRHDLYDVTIHTINVKFVINPEGESFSYCLEKDKSTLETIINEISWAEKKVVISQKQSSIEVLSIKELPSELSAFIVEAEKNLKIIASKSDTIVIDEKIDNKLNLMLYRCDDSCNLGYNIFEIIAVEDGYFLYNGFYVKGAGGAYKEPTCDIADDLSFLVIPEEYKSVIESFVK